MSSACCLESNTAFLSDNERQCTQFTIRMELARSMTSIFSEDKCCVLRGQWLQVLDDIRERLPEAFDMEDIRSRVAELTPYIMVAIQVRSVPLPCLTANICPAYRMHNYSFLVAAAGLCHVFCCARNNHLPHIPQFVLVHRLPFRDSCIEVKKASPLPFLKNVCL